jgi:hypothetical protein
LARPLREELHQLVTAVDNGSEVVSGEDDLLPHEVEFAEPSGHPEGYGHSGGFKRDGEGGDDGDDAAEWTRAMFPASRGDE